MATSIPTVFPGCQGIAAVTRLVHAPVMIEPTGRSISNRLYAAMQKYCTALKPIGPTALTTVVEWPDWVGAAS